MADRELRWMRLDNAAKIYPAAKRRNWNNLFRLSATLRDPVDPLVLQSALDVTVRRFPSIAVRIRRGMFWYYLEELAQAPKIEREQSYPLAHRSFSELRRCAFRVLYYENRIAVEFFHALTDGNGGLVFLKTLTAEYITQKYGVSIANTDGVLNRSEEPDERELVDSFLQNEGPVSKSRREETAYLLPGTREWDGYLNLTTGILDVQEVLALAKRYQVSLTTLMVSVMMISILAIQNRHVPNRRRQKPVKVLVPVNLRKFFDSSTLRNFVLYVTPGIDPKMGDYTLEEVLKSVHHQMGVELTQKQMSARITVNVRSEKSWALKIVPLFLKNVAMKLVYNMVGEKKSCIAFSNLGAAALPVEMQSYVDRLDFILGAQAVCPNNCGALTYGDHLIINFTRSIEEPELEREFFTRLRRLGLSVTIESNQR